MPRRINGGRQAYVRGVHAAVTAYLRAFAGQWQSRQARLDLEALARFELAVTGETIWRATFDRQRPEESDRWIGDEWLYWISGPDEVEPVEDALT